MDFANDDEPALDTPPSAPEEPFAVTATADGNPRKVAIITIRRSLYMRGEEVQVQEQVRALIRAIKDHCRAAFGTVFDLTDVRATGDGIAYLMNVCREATIGAGMTRKLVVVNGGERYHLLSAAAHFIAQRQHGVSHVWEPTVEEGVRVARLRLLWRMAHDYGRGRRLPRHVNDVVYPLQD